jgi:hypothetical protein
MRSIVVAFILATSAAYAIEITEVQTKMNPPMPGFTPIDQVSPDNTADHRSAFSQIVARTEDRKAAMLITTQRMARVKVEMVKRIETDITNKKFAVIVTSDGAIERRPVRVLATAHVKPKKPESKNAPIDGSHAAAAAAGALAAAAAAAAIAKAKGPKQNQPKGAP